MSPERMPDLSTLSESGLFSLYRAILSELKHRGVIRTENAPVGDYAQYLVATALGGQLAPNSAPKGTPSIRVEVSSTTGLPGRIASSFCLPSSLSTSSSRRSQEMLSRRSIALRRRALTSARC